MMANYHHTTATKKRQEEEQEEEDDDPLDAFMADLEVCRVLKLE